MWGQSNAIKSGEALAMQIVRKKGIEYVPPSAKSKRIQRPPSTITSLSHSRGSRVTDESSSDSISEITPPIEVASNKTRTIPSEVSNHVVKEFLKSLEKTMQELELRDSKLNGLIKEQKVLAKTRYINENQMGAVLSMKKTHKLQGECHRVALALDAALDAKVEIEAAVSRAKSLVISERGANRNTGWFKVGIENKNGKVFQEIQQLLEADDESSVPSKEELLAELAKL